MELIRGLYNIKERHRSCLLTIGNFDGIHRGHKALIAHLLEEGNKHNLPVLVMLFEPQPLELFANQKAPARLTCLREKLKHLKQAGINTVLCIRFDISFASYSAQRFILEILVKTLNIKFLAIGDDFRFGHDRKGDFLLLQRASIKYQFKILKTQTLYYNNQRISSTAVRQALTKNDFVMAEQLLGYPFSISGRVMHGNGLGSTIGVPTANIPLYHLVMPVKGVFIVEIEGISSHAIPGIANIGTRPTIKGKTQQLEVHLIDTCLNLYNKRIEVVLKKKIRNEQCFPSLKDLRKQIEKDAIMARKFFELKK
ncbi:bifunctional riboflavin kinase/FAD synthetase [Pantoea sp. Aalb]|uniref:bifunctional riboflavin kinase/FAD synthetase n=1 Tax=Pantoea sp. Aalb TaxID=2576762 RepID=UPI00132156E8|nr:bifunctional riboflavin kinase/FAD synthetase [Pantoea sp. Aalb]MXP67159.1 bifunctional riboflavin kinase/FAD synthetase [Pantoea sp. Aalb]